MNLIDMIKAEEGFREFVYDDATGRRLVPGVTLVGHATIGYGWACGINPITREEAGVILASRLHKAENDAAAMLGLPAWERLGEVRQAALTAMVYQLGYHGVRAFPMMLGALRSENWSRAHGEAMDSRWAAQSPERAKRVAGMLLTGEWPQVDAPLVA